MSRVRSTDPNDAGVVLNTIINGGGLGSVVTCDSGEEADTVLSGFVITGGNATDGALPGTCSLPPWLGLPTEAARRIGDDQ